MIVNQQLEWNRTSADVSRHLTVLDRFADNVRSRPTAIALKDRHGSAWTYAELDQWTTDAAALLRSSGVRTGDKVALIVDRTVIGCAMVLATVRAGAQYVPLAPRWPLARLTALVDQLDITHIGCDQAVFDIADAVRWRSGRTIQLVCPQERPQSESVSEMVVDLFDELAVDDDPLVANGFIVRGDEDFTHQDMHHYHARVRDLLEPLSKETPLQLVDLGCGPGTLAAAIADLTSSIVCVDPSYESVHRATTTLADTGVDAIGEVAEIRELDRNVLGDRNVALLASVAQFLPDLESFVDAVSHVASRMSYNDGPCSIVLADLVPPEAEGDALLRIPRALVESLCDLVPEVVQVCIHERHDGHSLLRQRYDAVLQLGAATTPSRPLVYRSLEANTTPSWLPPSPDPLAYAIFTSGTTGAPKAVQIDHRALMGLVEWMRDGNGVTADDVVLFTTAYSFDLSVFDIFGMWAIGGTVRIASQDELDEPSDLIDALEEEDITLWDSAPAVLQMLLPFLELSEGTVSTTLRRVMLSGDWVPLTIKDQIKEAFPNADVLALGGNTECTIWSNSFLIEDIDPSWPSVPYGHPMPNSRYYVLDADGELAAVGEEGDLYIAGECLAVDYARAPALTASKYGPDPFTENVGERMYATGDRALWLPEGMVQFRGRDNDQVKVRGHRIELGEVQANAVAAGVTDAVVITHQRSGEQSLALFYVDQEMPPEEMRAALEQTLPTYMVPATIRRVEQIPATTNGKADRTMLRGMIDD